MPLPTHPLRDPFLDRARARGEEIWAREAAPAQGPIRTRERASSAAIVDRADRQLARLALPPGTLVGLSSEAGPAFLEALVAAWGANLCPVLFDPTTTPSERKRLNGRLGVAWDWVIGDPWTEDLGQPRANAQLHAARATRVPSAAVLKLTSGSTGPPRGIAVSAEALAADTLRLARVMGFDPAERLLVAVPMSHSYGFSVLTAPALLCGSRLCFVGALDVLEAARRLETTFLPSVPSWYRAMLPLTQARDLPASQRLFLSAGAPLAAETARAFREKFGRPIAVLYGASECGGIAYDGTGLATERGSVGSILPGVRIELGQATSGGARAVNVHSDAVALGYVPALAGDELRLDGTTYRSEDLARVEDGELFLMGRTSDWINVRGKKVNPREVEAVIAELEGVDEVHVHGAPGKAPSKTEPANANAEASDSGEQQLRAVVASAQGTVDVRAVRAWCATRLAPHKRPRAIVILRELPRTARGKLDRAKLRAPHIASASPPRSH